MTMADVERQAETLPWGTPDGGDRAHHRRGRARRRQHGAVSFNRGAMPHEMFIEQIRRFAAEVLPALQAHEVRRVPAAEEAVA